MGSRCWECGDKIGRCYECGTDDCGHVGCRCTTTPDRAQPEVDVAGLRALLAAGTPSPECPRKADAVCGHCADQTEPMSAAFAVSAVSSDPLAPGTPVLAWPNVRDGSPMVTRTRGECWSLGDGTRVVAVEGYAGGIALTHIDVLPAPSAPDPHADAVAHQCITGPLCDRWPFAVDDAYRTIAALAWPGERKENRDGWAVTMRHRPELFQQTAAEARERLDAAIAHGRTALSKEDDRD